MSSASFWSPEHIPPHSAWVEHGPFAFWLIGELRPRALVELGTHTGFSYFAFCQAVVRLRTGTLCYAVDTWKGDEHAGFYEEDVFQGVNAYNEQHFSTFSTLIRSTFDEALEYFLDGSIDLLHIDGRHFYEDVKHDFESWRPKLSDRAIVLLHDINVRERGFGVFRLWNELCQTYPHFEFCHGHGLGVIALGRALPDSVQDFLTASADAAKSEDIQHAYGRLGAAVTFQLKSRQLESLATSEITRREEIERLAKDEIARREKAELEARTLFHERQELEHSTREEAARREKAEFEARKLFFEREELARLADELSSQRQELEHSAREEAAGREAAEARLATMLKDQQEAQIAIDTLSQQLAHIERSTLWRATAPLRVAGAHMPGPVRRAVRGAVKLTWWIVTGTLRRRLAARRRAMLVPSSAPAVGHNQVIQHKPSVVPAVGAFQADKGFLAAFETAAIESALVKLRRFKPFNPVGYLELHKDVRNAGFDPAWHALCFGAFEARPIFKREELARVMGRYLRAQPTPTDALNPWVDETRYVGAIPFSPPKIGLYVSSLGNIFMKEIAEDFGSDLRSAGVYVEIRDENSSIEDRSDTSIFIAPHEFFVLGRGREWLREDVVSRSFMLSTEQVQTPWFAVSLPILLMARGVIDICYQTADLLSKAGVQALHHLPGARLRPPSLTSRDTEHPLFLALPRAAKGLAEPSAPFALRPLDIAFFGTSTPYRSKFFARHASRFADFESFIYCRPPERGPVTAASEDGGLTRIAAHVSSFAKITLNIHRDEFGYFEWHRMIRLGMCAGSVVVTDPCLPHPLFVSGKHYLEECARYLPDVVDWLIRSQDGQIEAERIRANVDNLLAEAFDLRQNAQTLLNFLYIGVGAPDDP